MKINRVGLFFFSLLLSVSVWAQVDLAKTQINSSDLTPDIRVIIDISGSMKQSDPNNLRRPALELLVQLFPEGSKAGVWTFGQWVNNLVPSKVVNQRWRNSALSQANKINSVALRTNIPLALEKAVEDLANLDPRYKTHLILLTDGVVDVSKSANENLRARERIINVILPKLLAAGVTIHTVALSNFADQELMERLAFETNGLFAVAESAEDLTKIFLQAFDAASPAEQLPIEDNNFLVDASIDEFTALIFRQQGSKAATLITPSNIPYNLQKHSDNVTWFQQENYDLITVKSPEAGDWAIEAELEPNSRITIVSDLSLQVNTLPKSNFVSDLSNLVAALSEQDQTIDRPEFLNLVDMSVDVLRRDDNEQWQLSLSEFNPIPVDGQFVSTLDMLDQAGVYDVTVHVDGKTFQRQHKQTIAVREAFDVRSRSSKDSPPVHKVSLFARNPQIDSSNTSVNATIILPDGSQQSVNVESTADRRWHLELGDMMQAGYYSVSFVLTGQLNNGEAFTAQSPSIEIGHALDDQLLQGSASILEAELDATVTQQTPFSEPEQELEPPPEPEPKSELANEPVLATVQSDDQAKNSDQFGLYALIGIGNIIVVVLGFLAYKMITGSAPVSSALDDDSEYELDESELGEDEPEVSDDSEPLAATVTKKLSPAAEPEAINHELEGEIEAGIEEFEDLEAELLDVGEIDVEAVDLDLDSNEITEPSQSLDDLDGLDDILDLPDDAIDIDPGSDEIK
jgi:uncharacterized protein (TIGR03503 family)